MEYLFLGCHLKSPVIAGSNPMSQDASTMIRLYQAGAGAVVTKNVCLPVKRNPRLYLRETGRDTLINCERAIDYPCDRWIDREIPEAVKAGVCVIANVGMTEAESAQVVERLEDAGVSMIECVSYNADWLIPMVKDTKKKVHIPVIAKLSPNYTDLIGVARQCIDAGADAFTMGDSIGPVMRIDIRTGRPMTGGSNGLSWMSGAALKPFAIHNIAELRKNFDLPIIGMGGVENWEDGIEMMMAGADIVAVCSAIVTQGMPVLGEIRDGMEKFAAEKDDPAFAGIRGCTLKYLESQDQSGKFGFRFDKSKCSHCGRCSELCPYQAISFSESGEAVPDENRCSGCGLCTSFCDALRET